MSSGFPPMVTMVNEGIRSYEVTRSFIYSKRQWFGSWSPSSINGCVADVYHGNVSVSIASQKYFSRRPQLKISNIKFHIQHVSFAKTGGSYIRKLKNVFKTVFRCYRFLRSDKIYFGRYSRYQNFRKTRNSIFKTEDYA